MRWMFVTRASPAAWKVVNPGPTSPARGSRGQARVPPTGSLDRRRPRPLGRELGRAPVPRAQLDRAGAGLQRLRGCARRCPSSQQPVPSSLGDDDRLPSSPSVEAGVDRPARRPRASGSARLASGGLLVDGDVGGAPSGAGARAAATSARSSGSTSAGAAVDGHRERRVGDERWRRRRPPARPRRSIAGGMRLRARRR